MIPLRIITYFQNDEPLKWGIKLHEICTPIVIIVHSSVAHIYLDLEKNENTEIVVLDFEMPLYFTDTLKIIAFANSHSKRKAYNSLFVNDTLLYQNISLQLFYEPILVDYISTKNYIGYFFNSFYHYDAWIYSISNINVTLLIKELKEAEGYFGNRNIEIIEKYIQQFKKQFSDFNLQVSELISNSMLHIIGDSHVFNTLTPNHLIACRSHVLNKAKNNFIDFKTEYIYTHHLGSRTLFGFCKEEKNIGLFLSDLCVKQHDSCVFVLGEIDIRSHVFKYVNENKTYQSLIDELIENYCLKLNEIKKCLDIDITVMGIIPPMNGPNYVSEDYPIQGSLEQRVIATNYFNSQLHIKCIEKGFKYFEVNQFYCLTDGSLNIDFSDHFCHINAYYNYYAINLMAQTLHPNARYLHHELAI